MDPASPLLGPASGILTSLACPSQEVGCPGRASALWPRLRPWRFSDLHRRNQRLCLPVWGGVPEAIATIDEVLTRLRVVPASIDAWKGRSVSAIPGWSKPETIVLREADRSLVMRETGNDLIDTAPLEDLPSPPTAEEIDARRASCLACDRYRPGNDQCSLCGCGFVVAERIRSPVARCPMRWRGRC